MRRSARAQRRGQVDHDAAADRPGDRRRGRDPGARPLAARRLEGGARRDGRRAAARQPRHHADGRAEPARVRAPLPDPARRAAGGDRAGARDVAARRSPRHARGQALRRHAPAAADLARARAPAAARPARRADRRARPAGPPGAVGADRRAARRGRLDPDVHALHRGGPAARRHRDDHGRGQGRRDRAPVRAGRRARRPRGDRGLRAAGAARRGRGRGARRGLQHAPHRHVGVRARRRARERPHARGRAAAREPRGPVRAADRERRPL